MATVAVDEMRDKLLPLDDAYSVLEQTEPLHREIISSDSSVSFNVAEHWNDDIASLGLTEPVQAFMTVDGVERQMTLGGLLSAGVQFGAPNSYVRSLPGTVIANLLDFHYGDGMGSKQFGMLAVHENVAAFNRPTLSAFSNLEIMDRVVEGIQGAYGPDVEILADYKINNNLDQTDIRLIIPDSERTIAGTTMNDVPERGTDSWSAGIHIANSLNGSSQTSIEAYMFRWWCTNGCTTENAEVGTWSRKSNGQDPDSVYEWAREAVDEVLGGMENRFNDIQSLTNKVVASSVTADVLREIFAVYRVPVAQQDYVRDHLLRANEITMYTIMAAITEAANQFNLSNKNRDKLMRIGGNISNFAMSPDKARIWREGNTSAPTALNPYEFR